MTPEDLKSIGLQRFAELTDDEAVEVLETMEQLLADIPADSNNVKDRLVRARLEGFIYGYRLGARPK